MPFNKKLFHSCAVSSLLLALACVDARADEPQQAIEADDIVVEQAETVLRVIQRKRAMQEEVAQEKTAKTEVIEEAEGGESKPASDKQVTEEELRIKMRELEQQLQETRNQFQLKANEQRQQVQKEALKALDDIKLPANPTRAQCEEYIEELRKACEGRRSFSSSDPATIKLKELPTEHYDLLINEMSGRSSLRYYANYALRDIDPEKLRERFVSTIDENPNNIGIIVMHGWVEDIRPQIIEYINNADESVSPVSPAWFQAAVELDEPSLYPKLHDITTESRYANQFIGMLEMLPDYDLPHTVDVCWRRAKEGKIAINYSLFAAKAAEYGNADALESLIDTLGASSNFMSYSSTYNMRRTNVLKYIDFRGSNKEIHDWYKANKDKLVFDHFRKRFYVPEEF